MRTNSTRRLSARPCSVELSPFGWVGAETRCLQATRGNAALIQSSGYSLGARCGKFLIVGLISDRVGVTVDLKGPSRIVRQRERDVFDQCARLGRIVALSKSKCIP